MANPAAAMRAPLTMDDYLAARMIREPLCLYDMDIAVDGGDAFIITTAERAATCRCRRSWSTPWSLAWPTRTTRTRRRACASTASR